MGHWAVNMKQWVWRSSWHIFSVQTLSQIWLSWSNLIPPSIHAVSFKIFFSSSAVREKALSDLSAVSSDVGKWHLFPFSISLQICRLGIWKCLLNASWLTVLTDYNWRQRKSHQIMKWKSHPPQTRWFFPSTFHSYYKKHTRVSAIINFS